MDVTRPACLAEANYIEVHQLFDCCLALVKAETAVPSHFAVAAAVLVKDEPTQDQDLLPCQVARNLDVVLGVDG